MSGNLLVVVDSTLRFNGGGDTPGEADLFIALTPMVILQLRELEISSRSWCITGRIRIWRCVLGRGTRGSEACGETRESD